MKINCIPSIFKRPSKVPKVHKVPELEPMGSNMGMFGTLREGIDGEYYMDPCVKLKSTKPGDKHHVYEAECTIVITKLEGFK